MLDAFLLLFGFSSWLLYALYRRKQKVFFIILAAILAALAFSVKWTGATFLLVIFLFEIKRWRNLIILAVVPLAIYYALFTTHYALLSKPGPGDAFMSQGFQTHSSVSKFIELNKEMYRSNARLTATHPYSSKWYGWIVMARPIYYWNEGTAKIYLIGNPIVWWASAFGIFYVILMALTTPPSRSKLPLLFAGVFLLNLLPFVGISRAMFLYHYFTALVVAILALGYAIDQWQNKKKIFTGLILAGIAMFIWFAPLSYGKPLTDKGFNARMWFNNWDRTTISRP